MTDKILIVDDDKAVLNILYKSVRSNGIDADLAEDGPSALKMVAQTSYDLIILDINMPQMDGFEVIKRIRKNNIFTPIMVVSGRKDDYDTLYGLDIGADDYITKPFNPVTLGAKAKALIRRSRNNPSESDILTTGPFTFDTSSLRFFKNDKEISLSAKESSIIKLFMDNVDRIFSKEDIYTFVWGNELVDENAVMVYINRLRHKVEDDPSDPQHIVTVRGIGYRFSV